MSSDTRTGDKGPIAIKSNLGWLLSGLIESTAVANLASSHLIVVENQYDSTDSQTDDQLTSALKQFWETKSLGINLGELDQQHDHFYVTLSLCRAIIKLGYPRREMQLMSIIILILVLIILNCCNHVCSRGQSC